jgi:probable rRNA maturation factor
VAITIHWETTARPLEDAAVRTAAEAALEHGGRADVNLSVVFVDDEEMVRIHTEYLDDPTPTDVITFDLREENEASEGMPDELAEILGKAPVGELFVGVEMAQNVAKERGVSEARELALYVVHGALHLCGFDDHDPEQRAAMRLAERAVMSSLGYEADEAPHERQ